MAVPFFGFGDPIPFGTERNRHFQLRVSTDSGTSPTTFPSIVPFGLDRAHGVHNLLSVGRPKGAGTPADCDGPHNDLLRLNARALVSILAAIKRIAIFPHNLITTVATTIANAPK
jgi:hypothetical protein